MLHSSVKEKKHIMTFYESLALFSALPLIYGSVFSEQPHYPACQARCPAVLLFSGHTQDPVTARYSGAVGRTQ